MTGTTRKLIDGAIGKAAILTLAGVMLVGATGLGAKNYLIGFEMTSKGACNAKAFRDHLRAESEDDPTWLEYAGKGKVRKIPLMNPISKAVLRQIVREGMHNAFDRMVNRYIWTVTNTMTVTLVGDWNHDDSYRTITFEFDPGDKGRSAAPILNYLAEKKAGWRVVHSVFMAISNYNMHLERQHGVVGRGNCEDSDHKLEIRIDL